MAISTFKKILIRVAGVGILMIIIAGAAAIWMAGPMIKKAVETVGPLVTGVPVTVDKVDVRPWAGGARIQGFVLGNPTGFQTPHAISVGVVNVDLRLASLLSDTIVIDRVYVMKPEITYEGSLTSSNLSTILDQVKKNTGETEPSKPDEKKPETAGKKLVIKDFLLEDAQIHLSLKIMGGKTATVSVPSIHVTDIGTSNNGASVGEAVSRVMSEILRGTGKTITDSGDFFGKGVDTAGDSVKAAGESLKAAGKSLGEGFGKLLKKGQ